MIINNMEQDVCFGRGFTNDGILQKFKRWVVDSPIASPIAGSAGGPGWKMIEDQSGAAQDPYIVVSNHTTGELISLGPNAYGDNAHKILKIGYLDSASEKIYLEVYLWWAVGNPGVGYGLLTTNPTKLMLETKDDANFVYDFRGGPAFLSIATRRANIWNNFLLDGFTADPLFSDVPPKAGVLSAPVTEGANKTMTLGTGQGTAFTVGRYYYIFDINNNGGTKHTWVNYFKVTAKDADTITADYLRYDFPIGSVVHSYPNKIWVNSWSRTSGAPEQITLVPFISAKSSDESYWSWANQYTYADLDYDVVCIDRLAPDDEQKYIVQKIWLVEKSGSYGVQHIANRALGQANSVYVGSRKNIAQMIDGKLIDIGSSVIKEYLYAAPMDTIACIMLPNFNNATA